jgi:hypothetical protein
MLKLLVLITLAFISGHASALSVVRQLDPSNVDKQDYSFSVDARRGGKTVFVKVTVQRKPGAYWTKFISTTLAIYDGEKLIAESPVATNPTTNGVEVMEFSVSVDYIEKSRFTFSIGAESNGIPMPAEIDYWFYIKDFVDKK